MPDTLPCQCTELSASLRQILHMAVLDLAHKKLCQISLVSCRKYFLDLFLANWTIFYLFYAAFLILLTLFTKFPNFVDVSGLFGYLDDLFVLVSTVTCAEIPLCARNSAAQMF